MCEVVELLHPLVRHHLTILRDKQTSPSLFRQQTSRLATLLAVSATADLPTRPKRIDTPLASMVGEELKLKLAIVPILRAGLGMIEPLQQLLPEAEVWHLGMYRDELTALPVEYYSKLAEGRASDVAFVIDPMLATGGSVMSAIAALVRWGCSDIRVLSIIASQPGIDRLRQKFPQVKVFVCAIDPELDAHNFIVPGLGDAGDRIFNTLPAQ